MMETLLFLLTFFLFPIEKPIPIYFYLIFLILFLLKGKYKNLLFFFILGITCKGFLIKDMPSREFENFKGRVLSFPYESQWGISLNVKWEKYGIAPIYIQNSEGKIPLPGSIIKVRAERILSEVVPRPLSNKYDFYLKIKDLNQIELEEGGFLRKIIYFPARINQFLFDNFKTHLQEYKNLIPFVNALIFARFNYEEEEFYEAFQMAGVVHILSISGLHIGIFTLYFLVFLRLLKIPPPVIYILTIFFLLFFSSFCGFRAPVLRASLMVSLYFFFLLIHRPVSFEKTLYLSLVLNGFLMPHQVATPGFFLSYLSTYILIKSTPLFKNPVKSLIFSSLYVQIFIQPFLLYSFGIFNWQAVLLNPILIPFVFIFLLFSPVFLIFPFFYLLNIFDKFCFIIFNVIQSTKNYLWWGSFFPHLPLFLLIFYYFFSIFLIEKRKKTEGILYFLIFLTILTFFIHFLTLKYSDGEIVFLNVGQGSSTLIKDNFFNILIDTGKRDYFGWLLPSLLKEKVSYLNFLILSHPDEDHDRWAEKILETIPVGALGYPEIFSKEYEKLEEKAEKRKIKVYKLKKGSTFKTKNLYFEVLSPERGNYKDKNEGSLVFQINSKDKSFLIMSDATGKIEREILKNLSQKPFVLSVGHHGGKGSTSEFFLNCLKPRIAIISVGKRNPYSHPSLEVLENLKKNKILIFRTDQRGNIKIKY